MSSCQVHLFNTLPAFLLMLCLSRAVQLLRAPAVLTAYRSLRKESSSILCQFQGLLKAFELFISRVWGAVLRERVFKNPFRTPRVIVNFSTRKQLISLTILLHNMIILHACFRDWSIDCMAKYTHSWERIFLSHLVLLNYIDLFK